MADLVVVLISALLSVLLAVGCTSLHAKSIHECWEPEASSDCLILASSPIGRFPFPRASRYFRYSPCFPCVRQRRSIAQHVTLASRSSSPSTPSTIDLQQSSFSIGDKKATGRVHRARQSGIPPRQTDDVLHQVLTSRSSGGRNASYYLSAKAARLDLELHESCHPASANGK